MGGAGPTGAGPEGGAGPGAGPGQARAECLGRWGARPGFGLGASVCVGVSCCPMQELEEGAGKEAEWRRRGLWCQQGLVFIPLNGELLSVQCRPLLLDAHCVQGSERLGRAK